MRHCGINGVLFLFGLPLLLSLVWILSRSFRA